MTCGKEMAGVKERGDIAYARQNKQAVGQTTSGLPSMHRNEARKLLLRTFTCMVYYLSMPTTIIKYPCFPIPYS